MSLPVIKQRSDFVRAARRGRTVATAAMVLQAFARKNDSGGPNRVGFTTSKKVGNAVRRNRTRRRLRAAAAQILSPLPPAGIDYVLIGRKTTADMPFADLLADLHQAADQLADRLQKRAVQADRSAVS